MLDSIYIRNFKAFSGEHPFKLAPLTFVVGANSTGKSTILQSLLVLRQSWREFDDLPLDLRTEGALTSLGRPRNVVSGQQQDVLELGFGMPGASVVFGYDFTGSSLEARGQALTHVRLGKPTDATFLRADVDCAQDAQFTLLVHDARRDGAREITQSGAEDSRRVLRYTLSEGQWSTPDRHNANPLIRDAIKQHVDNARRALNEVQYVGPLRATAQRHYSVRKRTGPRVGVTGDRFVSLLLHSPEVLKRVNDALRGLELPYVVDVLDLGGTAPLGELQLRVLTPDYRERSEPLVVGLPDVGCGLSQLLPVLTQLAAAEADRETKDKAFGHTVLLEQPELHLHPRAQVQLGSFFAELVSRDRQRASYPEEGAANREDSSGQDTRTMALRRRNQIICETHSEHLINQVRGEVAHGRIQARDVTFLNVHQRHGAPEVTEIPLSSTGEFQEVWPDGFFATSGRRT
ncbi:MAG: hypothetical protein AMXMBFR64_05570 [Myxococcales bacterium]